MGDIEEVARPGGHRLRVYSSGPVDAATVLLLLHGGPGGGAVLTHAGFLDPARTRVITFDQRGTGLSQFVDPLRDNTTQEQVADIEAIRQALGVRSWVVAGGSWGALLAVLYARAHPETVDRLVLRSVYLGRAVDQGWLIRTDGPAPLARRALFGVVSSVNRGLDGGIFVALDSCLRTASEEESQHVAAAWFHYERVLSGLAADSGSAPTLTRREVLDVSIEMHYLRHAFFLSDDEAVLGAAHFGDLPGIVLHGTADGVILSDAADCLTHQWPGGEARSVPAGGHSLSDPAMRAAWQLALEDAVRAA